MKLLLLDAHSDAALACLQSLGRAGHEVHLGGSDSDVAAWRSRYASGRHLYPDPQRDSDGFLRWLREIDASHGFDWILPVTDSTIHPAMTLDRTRLRAQLALPPADSFGLAFDKNQTLALAGRLGIPIPRTTLVDSVESAGDSLGRYPLYLKPICSKVWRNGRGRSLSPRLVRNAEQLARALPALTAYGPVLIQEHVPGHGVGVEVLCDHGEIVMHFAHARIHEFPITGGRSTYRAAIAAPEPLLSAARRLMAELRWHGVAMVEFKRDGDQFWLMEINGRFWGSLPLALQAGVDFPRALIELLAHGRRPDPVHYRTGIYARNLLADFGWFWSNLRADKRNPLLMTRSTPRSLLEFGRLLLGREQWDHFSLRDPGPGLWQLRRLVGDIGGHLGRGLGRQWRLRRAPRLSARRLRELRPQRLLVLCHGNIYRSAFAAAYLRSRLLPELALEVVAAGFHDEADRDCPAEFVALAAELGVDLAAHRSRVVDARMVADADAILVMDDRNWTDLGLRFGREAQAKAIWFGTLAMPRVAEVPDPYGRPLAEARRVVATLVGACNALVARLDPPAPLSGVTTDPGYG